MNRYVVGAAVLSLAACSRAHATPPPSPAPANAAQAVLTVSSPSRTTLAAVGDPVPRFHALAHDGRTLDVAPGPRRDVLVLFFYPRDGTPG